ncbi:protein ALP1-like [Asparagus officinalis]|uniref:protein ALP1-like n=1 Tax=Asparagus officinalis TaxID=4686 RepID=UPI00098E135B|nr:protein ALP1-like [Asparagus officinalis]XP_020266887.1 protein ALP1-like [Asparagus officinalis]XP_020267046.1 protein ALP1-like [Asparagus officinalis]
MNFNNRDPSNLSSSFSDNEIEDEQLIDDIEAIDAEREAVFRIRNNNNLLMAYYINQQNNQVIRGGSIPGHIVINRDRENADRNLFNDYFSENPRYNDSMFRRRFRMSRDLFLRIVNAIKAHDTYFIQQRDGVGRLGLSTLQKITAVFRMLAYGLPADATDEYIKIGESTAIESFKRFCRAVVEVFAEQYLRSPNTNDIARLLHIAKQRGFPGMLGSLDCMHWKWKNCPTAWAGQYAGRSGSPTIILEAVADYDLWIWHAYFGLPGSNNDINVLEASHLFAKLAEGIAPPAHYVIQGKHYNMGYYLADGIYPKWSTLVQTIHDPRGPKKKLFAMKQEGCRKDVERAFGVLQSRFAIVSGPARFWKKEVLHDIMTACIIMHNMIIEDERDLNATIENWKEAPVPDVEMVVDENARFEGFLARHRQIKNKEAHIALRDALIDHLWDEYTNSET